MKPLPLESTSSLSLKTASDVQLTSIGDDCSQEAVTNSVPSGSLLRRVIAIIYLCGVNLTSSASNGLIVIGLPRLTEDLDLPPSLAFWPSSVQGLTTASTLLLTGAIADVLGPRSVNLLGCILNSVFILTCGLVKNGEELVVLRAWQGIATALHLSSSVALVTRVQPQGRERNLSFACLGLSQLLGFSSSLVMGGLFIDTIGWRSGWYFCGGLTLLLFTIGWWSLPRTARLGSSRITIQNLKTKVDWVGALLASASMSLLTYFLAFVDAHPSSLVYLLITKQPHKHRYISNSIPREPCALESQHGNGCLIYLLDAFSGQERPGGPDSKWALEQPFFYQHLRHCGTIVCCVKLSGSHDESLVSRKRTRAKKLLPLTNILVFKKLSISQLLKRLYACFRALRLASLSISQRVL